MTAGSTIVHDVTGRYRSHITSNSHYIFKRRYQDIEIELIQSGKDITGGDESGEFRISGSVEGGVISYYLEPSIVTGYYNVSGEWTIGADGDNLTGFWRDSRGDGPGDWNLLRLE